MLIFSRYPAKRKPEKEILAFALSGWRETPIEVWVYCPNLFTKRPTGILYLGHHYVKSVGPICGIYTAVLSFERQEKQKHFKRMYNLHCKSNKI